MLSMNRVETAAGIQYRNSAVASNLSAFIQTCPKPEYGFRKHDILDGHSDLYPQLGNVWQLGSLKNFGMQERFKDNCRTVLRLLIEYFRCRTCRFLPTIQM